MQEEIKQLLESQIEGAQAFVEADGNHVSITVIADAFKGLMPVKKQQLVYGVINDRIADGSIHAVNIKAMTPEQWQAKQ